MVGWFVSIVKIILNYIRSVSRMQIFILCQILYKKKKKEKKAFKGNLIQGVMTTRQTTTSKRDTVDIKGLWKQVQGLSRISTLC